MDDKIHDYYIQKEERKHKGVFPDMLFKDFADNWYELNVKNANCSQVNKDNYRNYVYTHIIPYFANYKLCEIHEDDCQRFLNQYVGKSKAIMFIAIMKINKISAIENNACLCKPDE